MSTFPPPPPLPGSRIESNRPYVGLAIVLAGLTVLVPVAAIAVLQLQDDAETAIPSDVSFGDRTEMPVADDGRQHPGEPAVPFEDTPLPPDWDVDLWGPEGSCVDTGGETVDCGRVHMGEVFARVRVPGQEFPGEQELADEGTRRCTNAYEELVGESAGSRGLSIVPSPPSSAAWDDGERRVVCLALALGAGTRGSIAEIGQL